MVFNDNEAPIPTRYDASRPVDRLVGRFAELHVFLRSQRQPELDRLHHRRGNEMTNSPGVTYTYDNVGNMITATRRAGRRHITYDYENRL